MADINGSQSIGRQNIAGFNRRKNNACRGSIFLEPEKSGKGILINITTGIKFSFIPLPDFAFRIADAGGLLQAIKK